MSSVGAIKAGKAYVEMTLKDQRLRDGLKANKERLRSFVSSIAKVAAAFALATAAASVKKFAAFGDELDKMSKRTGAAVEWLSQMKFAAEQSGTDVAALEKGLFGMSRAMFDASRGSMEALEALSRLGIEFKDIERLSPEQQFDVIADGLSQLEDASVRGAVAQKLMGRAGRQLLPLLSEGAAGMAAYRKEADELGLTLTAEQAKAAADVTDAWNRMKKAGESLVVTVGAQLAPLVQDLADFIALVVAENRDWVSTAVKVGVVLLTVVTAIKAVTLATQGYAKASAIATALSGPAGWLKLAAGAVAAGVAIGVVDKAFDSAGDSMEQADAAMSSVTDTVKDNTAAVEENAAAWDLASDRLASRARQEAALVKTSADFNKLMDGQKSKIDKLRDALRQLDAHRNTIQRLFDLGGGKDRLHELREIEQLRDRLVDSMTGFGGEIGKVRDQIALLKGDATETGLKLQEMAEAGLPADKLQQLREAYAELAELQRQDEAAKEQAGRDQDAERDRQQKRESLESRAAEIRDALKTPAERFAELVTEMKELVKAGVLERETAVAYLQEQRKAREAELKARADNAAQQFNAANSVDLRTSAGASLITAVLNRQGSVEERILKTNNAVRRNTATLVQLTRSGPRRASV